MKTISKGNGMKTVRINQYKEIVLRDWAPDRDQNIGIAVQNVLDELEHAYITYNEASDSGFVYGFSKDSVPGLIPRKVVLSFKGTSDVRAPYGVSYEWSFSEPDQFITQAFDAIVASSGWKSTHRIMESSGSHAAPYGGGLSEGVKSGLCGGAKNALNTGTSGALQAVVPGAKYAFFVSRSANIYINGGEEHGTLAVQEAFKRLGAVVEVFYIDGSVQDRIGLVRIP